MRAPAAVLAADLLRWYRDHARSLPWRSEPTPYRVLLSEFMLQQTRTETVIDRFHRFLERWPTLADLAAAEEEEVVAEWAGLGYYTRARNLHRTAVMARDEGGLPADPDALRRFPGIGPYTAGAIASIAFGVPTPVVDGNVERVLSRVDAREADPRSSAGRGALWARAGELVAEADAHPHESGTGPGDLNQALMELGATVCTPRAPRCHDCPWEVHCLAHASGAVDRLPRRAPRPKPKAVRGAAGILWQQGRVLLGQRPPRGLLGGLWEPISTQLPRGEAADSAVVRAFREQAGLEVRVGEPLGQVVHVFTHRRLTLEVVEVTRTDAAQPRCLGTYQALRWVDPARPDGVGLSTLARRTLALAVRGKLPEEVRCPPPRSS
jgi:A/G-specific adenine glycosylase